MLRFARRTRTTLVAPALVALLAGPGAAVAVAAPAQPASPAVEVPQAHLGWTACGTTAEGTAAGVRCATAVLPMDYDRPQGATVRIAVARVPAKDQAHRIGSLFFNFGGPGASAVDYLQANGAGLFAGLAQRFDIVTFDPRGVGQSSPAIDCPVNPITEGPSAMPFPTPLTLDVQAQIARAKAYVGACLAGNGPILAHVSTANVARDMDVLRAAVGDQKLTYLGFSYGTFLGATYAALFPDRYRALVLDGPVDAQSYIHSPGRSSDEQTAAFERALHRFLQACAVDQVACSGFGGGDPTAAFDHLIAAATATPIPAAGYTPDPRPVTGDDVRAAALVPMYAKQFWGILAQALAQAAAGDGSIVRALVDELFYGRQPDGSFDPTSDRFFTISAAEMQWPKGDVGPYLSRGARSWASFPHFYFNSGYGELPFAFWPVHDQDAYGGPFTLPRSSPTPLVVDTTYDPATPYPGGLRLAAELGNARVLTMDGDGHTAYGGNSACIDTRVDAYLVGLVLPPAGTVCQQEVPFTAPAPATAAGSASTSRLGGLLVRPLR